MEGYIFFWIFVRPFNCPFFSSFLTPTPHPAGPCRGNQLAITQADVIQAVNAIFESPLGSKFAKLQALERAEKVGVPGAFDPNKGLGNDIKAQAVSSTTEAPTACLREQQRAHRKDPALQEISETVHHWIWRGRLALRAPCDEGASLSSKKSPTPRCALSLSLSHWRATRWPFSRRRSRVDRRLRAKVASRACTARWWRSCGAASSSTTCATSSRTSSRTRWAC